MKTLLLLIAICIVSISATSQPQQRTWEYKFVYECSEKKANEIGQEGWELVTIGAPGSGPASNVVTFVFKRPK